MGNARGARPLAGFSYPASIKPMTTRDDDLTTIEWAQRYSWEDDFEDIMRCARRLAEAYPDIAFHLSAMGFRKALAIADAGSRVRRTANRQIAVVWPDGADLPSFAPYDPDQREGVLFAFDTAYPFEGELGGHPADELNLEVIDSYGMGAWSAIEAWEASTPPDGALTRIYTAEGFNGEGFPS